jgi:hypothetical protein
VLDSPVHELRVRGMQAKHDLRCHDADQESVMQLDNWGHIGGMLGGAFAGYLVGPRLKVCTHKIPSPVHVNMYACMYVCICIYIYIYIYQSALHVCKEPNELLSLGDCV